MVFSSHPVGFEVEVRSSEEGFKGAWFEATVVRSLAKYRRYTVTYAALVSDEVPTKPLEDTVYCTFVRPRPPPRSDPGARFELHQLVEALHNDGWWKGVVSEVPDKKDGLYRVCFPVTREEFDFTGEELREQLEWVKGKWVSVHNQKVEEEDLTFVVGSRIEVSRDKENYAAAWYVGTVLKVIGKNNILVEYDSVEVDTDGVNSHSLKEIVDLQYIRPYPPPASKCDSIFDVLEEVEAFHKCGWVAGVVSELRGGLRYVVKFKHQEEEIEVDKTAIRPRFDWVKGHWVHISREKSGTSSHRRRRKSVAAKRSSCRVSALSFNLDDGGVAGTSDIASLKGMKSERHIVDGGVEASQPSRMLKKDKFLEELLKKDKFLEEHLKLVEGTLSVGRTSKRRSRSGKRSSLSIDGVNSPNNNVEEVECFTSLEDNVIEGTNFEERVNFSQPSKKLEKGKSLVEHLQVVDSTLVDCGFKTSQKGGKNSLIGLLSEGSPALVTGRQNSNRPSRQQVGKKSILLSFPSSTEQCQEQGTSRAARSGQTLAGGKGANQACCAAKLSSQHPTYFVAQIGDDAHGRLIHEALALSSQGLHLDCLARVSGAPTGHAVVMLQSDGQNSIIIVGGANMSCWPDPLRPHHLDLLTTARILLLQREIPDRVNVLAAQAAKNSGASVILDLGGADSPIPKELIDCVDILSPNETELARLTGMPTVSFEQIVQAALKCHEMGVEQVLVKLGAKGSALFVEGEEPIRQSIIPAAKVIDTTGAGDTFTAAFAVALAEGRSKKECLQFAAAAASLCVQVKGAIPSMPERNAVEELLESL